MEVGALLVVFPTLEAAFQAPPGPWRVALCGGTLGLILLAIGLYLISEKK